MIPPDLNFNTGKKINPFPGVRPYTISEKDFYYIKKNQREELLSNILNNKFLALVGNPGSGKTSLINCVLIPGFLERKKTEKSKEWKYFVMRPATNPIMHLAHGLAEAKIFYKGGKVEPNFSRHLEALMKENIDGLLHIFEEIPWDKDQGLVICIDHFEDLFKLQHLYADPQEETYFINLLIRFIQRNHFPVHLVFSLSSECLALGAQHTGLIEVINKNQYLITRPDSTGLSKLITHAIQKMGAKAEQALIASILRSYKLNAPPIYKVQHALRRTVKCWQANTERSNVVEIGYYHEVGGLDEVIQRDAQNIYNRFNAAQKRICKQVFAAVTDLREGIKYEEHVVLIKKVAEICLQPVDRVIGVISAYQAIGLLKVIPSGTIESKLHQLDAIPEERKNEIIPFDYVTINLSLVNEWDKLQLWFDEEKKNSGIYKRLARSAMLNKEGREGFYSDPELDIALKWRHMEKPNEAWAERYDPRFQEAMAFLDQSIEHERRSIYLQQTTLKTSQRNRQLFKVSLIIFSLISAGLAIFALSEASEAHRERARMDNIQTLDSMKGVYLNAMQDLDSLHVRDINRMFEMKKKEVRPNVSHGAFINDLTNDIASMHQTECQEELRGRINKLQRYILQMYREPETNLDKRDRAELIIDLCDRAKGNCEYLKESSLCVRR